MEDLQEEEQEDAPLTGALTSRSLQIRRMAQATVGRAGTCRSPIDGTITGSMGPAFTIEGAKSVETGVAAGDGEAVDPPSRAQHPAETESSVGMQQSSIPMSAPAAQGQTMMTRVSSVTASSPRLTPRNDRFTLVP